MTKPSKVRKMQSVRGMHDVLPDEAAKYQVIEAVAKSLFARYGIAEVRFPILEPSELFVRSIGEVTDIVSKEMYRFIDQGGDDLCLRPEGTAGAVRAWMQAGLARAGEQRWFYVGPMFRRERPQKGRLRQFQQMGVELFAAKGPIADIELLSMAWELMQGLSLKDVQLEINSLGCHDCRPVYRQDLLAFLQQRRAALCDTCQLRIEQNPMRVLDCKNPDCQQQLQDAPEMLDHLCSPCETHFQELCRGLEVLSIPFVLNPRIVRGLDYYQRTAFEITTQRLGAQGTVLAGGRYDGLIESLGGPATAAIGFAMGMERIAMLMPDIEAASVDVAVVVLGAAASHYSLQVAKQLRDHHLTVVHAGAGSAKRQFKVADREQAAYVVVVGDDELADQQLTVKNMQTGVQQRLSLHDAIALFVS